ncbi:MAG: hypothetical protein QOK17_977 [Sphingomonadales bacterium]|jgi:hypothetical protein|nr:hypothetical protein [Sphingomonadales bacterium]
MAKVSGIKRKENRLLAERPLPEDGRERRGGRARPALVRSVTVNLAESPLGWLRTRGHVTARQFAAGEQLRSDWETAQLPPVVTMQWDAPPPDRNRRGAPEERAPGKRQIAARRRFEAATSAIGPGLRDIAWRVVCAGEGMRDAETALGWPARAGKLVLQMALDRLADHYRMR